MKKLPIIGLIVLSLITVGLFPVDLFYSEIPDWVFYTLTALILALTVLIFAKGKHGLPAKVFSVFLTVAVTAAALCGIWLDPYFNSISLRITDTVWSKPYDTQLSADAACADIDYAVKYLVKDHPALKDGLTAELKKRCDEVRSEIRAAGSVSVCELAGYAESIFSLLGDSHTWAYMKCRDPLYLKHWYRWKNDNYSITSVNGTTIKELLEKKKDLYSFESESWELKQMKDDLLTVHGLAYLGYDVGGGITYTFENDEGDVQSETYYADDFVTYNDYRAFNGLDTENNEDPVFVRYTIDEEKSLALMTLDSCVYNDEYIECVREMFREVKEKGIRNIAVDLRKNSGGNDMVAVEFISYLDTDGYKYASETQRIGFFDTPLSPDYMVNKRYIDLTFKGDLYVLSSAGTFSSAMLFTQYIKDNSLGTVIGEPAGNDPNGYGEIAQFVMPNSRLGLSVSTKRFFRADKECKDRYVMPDIACNASEADEILLGMIK